jgi:hypothetical protein
MFQHLCKSLMMDLLLILITYLTFLQIDIFISFNYHIVNNKCQLKDNNHEQSANKPIKVMIIPLSNTCP